MKTYTITIWILYVYITRSSTYQNPKNETVKLLKKSNDYKENNDIKTIVMRHFGQQTNDFNKKSIPAGVLIKSTHFEEQKKKKIDSRVEDDAYYVATEHPWLQRRSKNRLPYRRQYKYKDLESKGTSRESSTSNEMRTWKEEFELEWINGKIKAINEKLNTSTGAININMAAGRPWSIPCGDPNQHDLPWGTCMLSFQCESEFRIYRGDSLCGRSSFVCCSIQLTHHDLYQGIDMSFIDTSISSSSREKRQQQYGSKEYKRKKKRRELNRKRKRRFRLKRQIKKRIRKLARQIRKELNRAFRNATGDRRHKTRMLKNEIKKMKQKFYLDRKLAKNLHDFNILKIDNDLKSKLAHVKNINHNFLMNDTYREIILGKYNNTGLRMLLKTYPQLQKVLANQSNLPVNSSEPTRRSGGRTVHKKKKRKIKDYLEYDIEYGILYY